MSKHLRDPLGSVRFVLGEMVRHQEMLNRGERTAKKEDMFCTISHPSGRGSLPIGRAAYDAVGNLAAEAARRGNIIKRSDPRNLRSELTERLVQMFVLDGIEPSAKSVAKLLRDTQEALTRRFETQIHVLPCHLSTEGEDAELALGPVRFVGRARARRILAPGVLNYRRRDHNEYRRDRDLIAQGLRFYGGYRWFAAVTVRHSDSRRSEELAKRAATSALDCLQLLIGARHSHRMAILGPSDYYERSFLLGIAREQLRYTVTTSYLGEITLPDGWMQMIEKDYPIAIERIGTILESVAQADLERPLSRRFLDAAQWFGEAVRDPAPATRLIKFVLALERLVLTGEAFGLTETISARVASLCIGLDDRNAEQLKADFKMVYDIRSKLAHGGVSPSDPRVSPMLGLAADFAQHAMLRCLHVWQKEQFELAHLSTKKVKAWFHNLVALVFSAQTSPLEPQPEAHADG
ncbi:MAG TPA: hypothetical protein VGD66_15140 [Allosphingosinicella sp.]|jgi:hypothetical protein